jgi:hypothetical protein
VDPDPPQRSLYLQRPECGYSGCPNYRSGGQDGPHLLDKFRDVMGDPRRRGGGGEEAPGWRGEVVNMNELTAEGRVLGPRPSLLQYSSTPGLRIIGEASLLYVLA